MLHEVLKQIRDRERFLLTSHARPDGDAVGSTLACGELLRQLGKQVDIVLHDGVPVRLPTGHAPGQELASRPLQGREQNLHRM